MAPPRSSLQGRRRRGSAAALLLALVVLHAAAAVRSRRYDGWPCASYLDDVSLPPFPPISNRARPVNQSIHNLHSPRWHRRQHALPGFLLPLARPRPLTRRPPAASRSSDEDDRGRGQQHHTHKRGKDREGYSNPWAELWGSLFSPLPKRPQLATTVGAGGGIVYPLALESAALAASASSAPAFWMVGSGDGEEDGLDGGSGDEGGMPSLPIPTPAVFQTLRPLGSVAVSPRRPPSAEEGHEEHAAATAEVEEGSAQGSSPPPEEPGGQEEEEDAHEEGEEVTYEEEVVGDVVIQVQRIKEEEQPQPQESSMEAAQQEEETEVEVEAGAEEPLGEADQEGLRRYKLRALVLQDELQRTRGALEEQAQACAAARAEARGFEALAAAREEEMAQTRKVGWGVGVIGHDSTDCTVAYCF